MKKQNIKSDKLILLANHLLSGKLTSETAIVASTTEHIEYEYFSEGRETIFDYIFKEAAILFPDEWRLDMYGNPILKEGEGESTTSSAMKFFWIDFDMFSHICTPDSQNVKRFGGKPLTRYSTPYDVATNILCLVKKNS